MNPIPLLLTKTYIPESRPDWIARPRLLARLDQIWQNRLGLISAPAGYGKTALLAQWVQSAQTSAGQACFAWLSLDENDNDPVRFWSYVLQALRGCPPLQTLGSAFLDALQPLSASPVEQVLPLLLNELAQFAQPVLLILEDTQALQSGPVQNSLAFFVEHAPHNLHILLAGRVEPQLPLARYRARRQLVELHTQDLRFTSAETAEFFEAFGQICLADSDLEQVNRRTEGWIAGMQLAILSLEGQEDKTQALLKLNGQDPYILDYLAEEILLRQPPLVQQFLLKTSLLERLNAPLCELLAPELDGTLFPTGASAEALLAYLERSHLFILPLDQRRTWYRYHPLFAELLQVRLQKQASPAEICQLHQRAANWYASQGYPLEAFSQARAAGDFKLALQVYNTHFSSLVESGELATLLAWLKTFPEDFLHTQPELCLGFAWVALYRVRFEEAETWAGRAGQLLPNHPQAGLIDGQIKALRATVAINRGQYEQAAQLSREALAQLDNAPSMMRALLYLNLGDASSHQNNFTASAQSFENALETLRPSQNSTLEVIVIGSLGHLYLQYGKLRQGEAILQQALTLEKASGKPLLACGKALIFLSRVYTQWHKLEQAHVYAQQAVTYCQEWGHTEHKLDAALNLAEVYQAQGRLQACQAQLEQVKKQLAGLERQNQPALRGRYALWINQLETWNHIENGQFEAAAPWLEQSAGTAHFSTSPYHFSLACLKIKLHLAQGQAAQDAAQLEQMQALAQRLGWLPQAIDALNLLALLQQQTAQTQAAADTLSASLRLAQPEGFKRAYLKHGQAMAGLLKQLPPLPAELAVYQQDLLAAFTPGPAPVQPAPVRSAQTAAYEALSDRELQILRLVAAGLSNDQIASALILSTNTVKTHLKRLYAKLNTANRLETVSLARELGLL
jgi:LuxR family maltose regulon positive regulatory protein